MVLASLRHAFFRLYSSFNCILVISSLRKEVMKGFVQLKGFEVGKKKNKKYVSKTWRFSRDLEWMNGVGGGRMVRWSWVNFQCRGVLLV